MMDKIDRLIIKEISGDMTTSKRPYLHIANKLNISQEEVLARLKCLQSESILKRIAPVIAHQNTEYTCNALSVWVIPEELKDETIYRMKSMEKISHVYERETKENWPYNIYAMVHGRSLNEVESIICDLSSKMSISNFKVLFTRKQWKKSSPDIEYLLG